MAVAVGGAPSHVPHVRHDGVDVLARECPGVDLAVAALVVTELTTNVVNHAYLQAGGRAFRAQLWNSHRNTPEMGGTGFEPV